MGDLHAEPISLPFLLELFPRHFSFPITSTHDGCGLGSEDRCLIGAFNCARPFAWF